MINESWTSLNVGFLFTGTDGDTVRMVFAPLIGLGVSVRCHDGRTFGLDADGDEACIRVIGFRQGEEDPFPMFLQLQDQDPVDDSPRGDMFEIPFEDIALLGVF